MNAQQRTIVHMDLDTFFVSCERLLDNRLVGKPVLIGGTTDRGVVAACSYEARRFGVHSAMPMKMALQRCPEAIVIKGNSSTYTEFSRTVTDIIREAAPVYEKASIDEFYMDLTGMDKYFGCLKYTSELRQKIMRETRLPISFGLSINKTVSKIATGEAKPCNQMAVDSGTEKSFMAPLSIRKMPMVGLKTYQTLCNLGIKRISTVQDMPMEMMESVLGQNGISLWKKAQGLDQTPVIQYNDRKSISNERTFDRDTIDMAKLRGIIIAMAENLAFQLRRGRKVCACVSVKIRYSDFQTKSIQQRIPYTAADHELIPLVSELFEKLYNRRILVRLVGVKYSEIVSGHHQMNLFENGERYYQLYHAMDKIRQRFGDRAVVRAIGMQATSIGGWNPFTGEPPSLLANRRQ